MAGSKGVDAKTPLDFSLPGVGMNAGAVALQAVVVQFDDDQQEMIKEFWSRLDTMKMGFADRQIADINGLRYGVISPQCPAVLDQLLERESGYVFISSVDQKRYLVASDIRHWNR